MALKPCRECKKKVSTEASTCPSCGVPNPTKVVKVKKLKPDYGYARCEKTFCNSRYKLLEIPVTLIGAQTCQACGNTLQKVKTEDALRDIERRKSTSSNTPNRTQTSNYSKTTNDGEYFFNGTKSLGVTFWGYFFGGNAIFRVWEYVLVSNRAEQGLIYFVGIIHLVWLVLSVMGVFNSAERYKKQMIKSGQTYGYATAAKIGTVVLILSAIGNAL